MDDLHNRYSAVSQRISEISPEDVPAFIRNKIAERGLLPLIRDLNQDVLSGDAFRKNEAEHALRRLGFL